MRNKFLAKLIALVIVCIIGVTAVGCSAPGADSGNSQTLDIYLLEQGYGRDWLDNTIEEFKKQDWVKQKYPELVINKPTINDKVGFAAGQLGIGKKSRYDILFGALIDSYYGTDAIVDLTEKVYEKTVPGESITYGDKLNASSKAAFAYVDPNSETGDTQYYAVPYTGGMAGFIYNEEALKSYGYNTPPNTTDEFYEVAKTIRDANKSKYDAEDKTAQYVFMQSNDAPYWQKHGFETWWAQYEGVKGYEDFFNGIVDGQRSVDIFKQKGRLESLKIFEKMLDYEEQFLHPESENQKYMPAQTAFLQGSAVFHFNGDWFTDEMKEIKQDLIANDRTIYTIKMMKTPIISSIVDKCTTIKGESGSTADQELSALITAIDAGSTSLTGTGYNVNQKDFNKVYEARRIVCSTNSGGNSLMSTVIPSVSNAQDLAADFLLFMATDIGIAAYCEGASGATIDFKYNPKVSAPELYASLEPLHQGRIDYMLNDTNPAIILKDKVAFPLSKYGGVTAFVDTTYYSIFKGKGNTITAQDIYDNTIAAWTNDAWTMALTRAGIND